MFFKHIFNSIKNKPLQPILVIFCIAIAVAIFVSTYMVRTSFDRYNRMINVAAVGTSDIAVRVDSDSMIRYMHLDNAVSAVGDDGAVVGMFGMTLLYHDSEKGVTKNSVVNVKAVDFSTLNDIYSFKVLEYGVLSNTNVDTSALISSSFAKAHNLSLHDSMLIELGNETIEYKVEGIFDSVGLMKDTQVLVSFKSVMRKIISEFGIGIDENVKLCNVIYIDMDDDGKVGDMIETLRTLYPNNAVGLSHSEGYIDSLTFVVSIVLYFMSLVFACIGIIIIYSSLTIISGDRSHSSSLFVSVGATTGRLRAMQIVEILIYAIIGGFLGIAISLLPTFIFSNSLGIAEIDFTISWQEILIGVAFAIGVALISQCTIFIRNSRFGLDDMLKGVTKKHKALPMKYVLILLAVSVLLIVVMFLMPVSLRFIPYAIVFALIILIISFGLPYVSKGIALLSEKILKKTRVNGTTVIAFKTVKENLSISNSQRILCIMAALLTVIGYSILFANKQKQNMTSFMKGDVIVANVSQISYGKADDVKEASGYFLATKKDGVLLPNGLSIMILSADTPAKNVATFASEIDKVPTGNEIYLTEAVVKSLDKKTGDTIVLTVDSKPKEFKIAGTFDTSLYVGFVDNEYIDSKLGYIVFAAKNDVYDLEKELSKVFGTNSTIMLRTDELIKESADILGKFINLVNILVIFVCVFGLIGWLNSYVQHYFGRKPEFALYHNIGMTKKELSILLTKEAAINFSLAIILGFAIGLALVGLSSVGLLSFGIKFL